MSLWSGVDTAESCGRNLARASSVASWLYVVYFLITTHHEEVICYGFHTTESHPPLMLVPLRTSEPTET
ncbi:hypothetical protein DPEC_G00151510 [Dallia pectoralis]|uniref:Uncharacterized protein n=1 Tax=Dallia pectoralis TaxID=75939 RepID=A0ACC2GJM6_DALPE|nr:hypothetical protein DPEC_G00151510 [Dallia pectoralis]